MRARIAEEQGMAALANLPAVAPPPPHSTEERRAHMKRRLSVMSVDAFIGASGGVDVWPGTVDRLADLRVPTLVICGELDALFAERSKQLAAAIAGAELVCVPEAAHAAQFERPELFNAALRRHLERNACPP
jgi:pimeloyl-ACP methyl ester carboxylesterase